MIQSEEKYYSKWELVLIKENDIHNDVITYVWDTYSAAAKKSPESDMYNLHTFAESPKLTFYKYFD